MLISTVTIKYAFDKVKADILRVMACSLVFYLLKTYAADYVPEIPAALPTVLGTSISLLLAFNLNQSYDRWWEARKVWGAIVNDSRTLVMQLTSFVGDPATIERVALRQIAFVHALGQTLRGHAALTPAQAAWLTVEDTRRLATLTNQPLAILMGHQAELTTLHAGDLVNDYQQIQIDSTLVRLTDAMGRAERIKSTVFPVTYRLFVHYFIYLFLLVLSFALVGTLGAYEMPILVVVASNFFLLERSALYMQDPFSDRETDTPVTAIARTIEINLRQMIGNDQVPAPILPTGFFLK